MTVAIVIAATLSGAGSNLAWRAASCVSARAIRLIISRHLATKSKDGKRLLEPARVRGSDLSRRGVRQNVPAERTQLTPHPCAVLLDGWKNGAGRFFCPADKDLPAPRWH
jgi:hypothetical protein